MRLIEYTPSHFEALHAAIQPAHPHASLCHRPFVDYYYASTDWCRLYLALDRADDVAGTIGVEQLPVVHGATSKVFGFPSNFFSLRPGVGAFLLMQWLKSCPVGMVVGGTEDIHRLIGQMKWRYFPGVKSFFLNRAYTDQPGDAAWRRAAKWAIRQVARPQRLERCLERIPAELREGVTVEEQRDFTDDLLPSRSRFSFRLASSPGYLRWRYAPGLSFIRHRIFRVVRHGESAGYVVINDASHEVHVAHADGPDPASLAVGMLFSLCAVTRDDLVPRECLLVSAHPPMQAIFRQFGFRGESQERLFAFGTSRGGVDLDGDVTTWLVNFDWGDIGLRPPFRDQVG